MLSLFNFVCTIVGDNDFLTCNDVFIK